ncbi:hypothetical protein D7X32_26910 [Corallococcus carmarthensis]|uniref:Uncharacterized protein n=1 Tax=Corallococcus carmarthensis TaxID=2316728 RepID=A0A3A8JTW8_9BACT|nr:hypothetical protein D7X32_26910 [Corallococcus carmarthensis]
MMGAMLDAIVELFREPSCLVGDVPYGCHDGNSAASEGPFHLVCLGQGGWASTVEVGSEQMGMTSAPSCRTSTSFSAPSTH